MIILILWIAFVYLLRKHAENSRNGFWRCFGLGVASAASGSRLAVAVHAILDDDVSGVMSSIEPIGEVNVLPNTKP